MHRMSISMGILDQYDHPDFEERLRFVIRTCGARNIPVAAHLQSVELSTKWIQEGVRFVLHKTDVGALHEGFRHDFDQLRQVGDKVSGQTTKKVKKSDVVI